MINHVVFVLRSGGDFGPEHVRALFHAVVRHWPRQHPLLPSIHVLTDQRIGQAGLDETPLVGHWVGWWSKMEMFRPDVLPGQPFLYVDLDTAVVRDLTPVLDVPTQVPIVLRDFYHGDRRFGSGVMVVPADRGTVWERWLADHAGLIRRHRVGGDQTALQELGWGGFGRRWQDVAPGAIVSYKVHVRPAGVIPTGARLVCFHGRPRPWQVTLPAVEEAACTSA